MLAANIEKRVREIVETKGKEGWIRVQECAIEYAKDAKNNPRLNETVETRKTKFYRWRKKVGKGKVKGFKVLLLPGNISYIGLEAAKPETIQSFISGNKKANRNVKTSLGFLDWLEKRAERKENKRIRKKAESKKERERDYHELMATLEKMQTEDGPDLLKKIQEIDRKHGLIGEDDTKT